MPQWQQLDTTCKLQDARLCSDLHCALADLHYCKRAVSSRRECVVYLLLNLIVELVSNDGVALVLAANHVHSAAGKGVPGQELHMQKQLRTHTFSI